MHWFRFQFRVTAYDNRPLGVQKTAVASVRINIARDSGPPQFISTPYNTLVDINTPIQMSVFKIQAIDNDLQVLLILYHEEKSFFQINILVQGS